MRPIRCPRPLFRYSPLDRWSSMSGGKPDAAMSAFSGEAPVPAVPVPQVTIPQPTPGRVRLPPCPRYEGSPVIDARGLSWRAKRDAARNAGLPFGNEP